MGIISRRFAVIFMLVIFLPLSAAAAEDITEPGRPQGTLVRKALSREKRSSERRELVGLLDRLDSNYGYLDERLAAGGKVVVFMDPAHGKLPSGRWQGEVTERLSATGLPEEYYSIKLSRRLYHHLSANPHIEVRSTPDFMELLRNEREDYRNIPFLRTVRLADECDAFIILSEHLNNVSVLYKAGGHANIPGLHVISYRGGKSVLTYIHVTYSGFLTLYNKLDGSGFCRDYALALKEKLQNHGYEPNSWDYGAVADDRFTYFTDFPLSVIYETGFISNPVEERMLTQPDNIEKITLSQYRSLLEEIKNFCGMDISGENAVRCGEPDRYRLDLMKLSRIAVYYIKKGDTRHALNTINDMWNNYRNSSMRDTVRYYRRIGDIIQGAEHKYSLGLKYSRKKKYSRSRKYFRQAKAMVYRTPLLSAYFTKYSRYAGGRRYMESREAYDPDEITRRTTIARRLPLAAPIILPIEEGQSLEEAIFAALEPDDPDVTGRIAAGLKEARIVSWKKVRKYSKKRKRYITSWKKQVSRVDVNRHGIYVIRLDRNLRVKSVKKVGSIRLDASRYQNQQFLKNSYFASGTKDKAL